jgi:nicotinamide mononucleotide transporter
MTALELVAAAFGVACVWLYSRQSIWSWPAGLVQVVLFIWIFYEARLYSDVILHLVYVGLCSYGWWYWAAGGSHHHPLRIRRLGVFGLILSAGVAVVGTATLGFAMDRYTDADLAYWDATTTVLSLIAQFLIAKKILENWLVWIVVDVLAIGIYAVKGLYVTSALYCVFLCLAVYGWMTWIKALRGAASAGAGGSYSGSFSPRIEATSSSSTSPAATPSM